MATPLPSALSSAGVSFGTRLSAAKAAGTEETVIALRAGTPRPANKLEQKTNLVRDKQIEKKEHVATGALKSHSYDTMSNLNLRGKLTRTTQKLSDMKALTPDRATHLKEKIVTLSTVINGKKLEHHEGRLKNEAPQLSISELKTEHAAVERELNSLKSDSHPSPENLNAQTHKMKELEILTGNIEIKSAEAELKTLQESPEAAKNKKMTLIKEDVILAKMASGHLKADSLPSNTLPKSFQEKIMGKMAATLAEDPKNVTKFGGGSGGIYGIGGKFVFKAVDEEPGQVNGKITAEHVTDTDDYPAGQGPLREYAASSSPLSSSLGSLTFIKSSVFNYGGGEVIPKKGILTLFTASQGNLEDAAGMKEEGLVTSIKNTAASRKSDIKKMDIPEDKKKEMNDVSDTMRDTKINKTLEGLSSKRRELATKLNISEPSEERFMHTENFANVKSVVAFEPLRMEIYARCPLEEVQQNKAFDLCYANTDANFGNELLVFNHDGSEIHAVAIDRGKILPIQWPEDYNVNVSAANNTPPLTQPVNEDLKAQLASFDVDAEVARLNSLFASETKKPMTPTQENVFRAHTAAVKVGVENGATLQEISDYITSGDLKELAEAHTKNNKINWPEFTAALVTAF